MTVTQSRLEALVIARASGNSRGMSVRELMKPLARFAPRELTPAAWQDRLAEIASELRARDVLDAKHRLRDAGELARRIGPSAARTWQQLVDRVLPALALGIAADDGKRQARLAGRDAWAAAIVGRALGLWGDGPPPSLPALCDALAWRELGLPGKPKRCPPEIRAVFVQRRLGSDAGPPERLVRVLAAREIGAPSSEQGALRDALVRGWLAGRVIGAVAPAAGEAPPAIEAGPKVEVERYEIPDDEHAAVPDAGSGRAPADPGVGDAPSTFVDDVLRAASAVTVGWFGDRKVFVSALWDALRGEPRWAAITLDDFKARLVAAHRAGELTLVRADLVAAMDPELVAASEIAVDGASFHFLVKEPVT